MRTTFGLFVVLAPGELSSHSQSSPEGHSALHCPYPAVLKKHVSPSQHAASGSAAPVPHLSFSSRAQVSASSSESAGRVEGVNLRERS